MSEHRIVIDGKPEARYWNEIEAGDRSGLWTATGQPGPPIGVTITPAGVQFYVAGMGGKPITLRPSQARWFAVRLLEGCGVYETVFGGDGSNALGGTTRQPLERVMGEVTGRVLWLCGCGKSSTNRGAMVSHNRNKCDQGPAKRIVGGANG